MSTQEEQAVHESEVKAQEGHEDANSLHGERHESNRHMTWHNAWWIRVANGPHMRSARGRRRTRRAARQVAEQVRNGSWVGETREGAEEAETDNPDSATKARCTSCCTCRKTQVQARPPVSSS